MLMKYIIFLLIATTLISCKDVAENKEGSKLQRFADVDTSSNDVVHMNDLDNMYHSLDDVVAANNGKLVYVDIWASWCGPCIDEFPASKALQEKYKDEDVSFVYVSIDRNNKAWEAAAKNLELLKNSYLIRNYPSAALFQENDVSYIPRYLLYDKNGRLVGPNAPRPSTSNIVELLDAFLSI